MDVAATTEGALNASANTCNVTILTGGKYGKAIGFINTDHCDGDNLTKYQVQEVEAEIRLLKKLKTTTTVPHDKQALHSFITYIERFKELFHLGIPTHCAYVYIGLERLKFPYDCVSYFLHSGLESVEKIGDTGRKLPIAARFGSGNSCINYAHTHTHSTAVPICLYNGVIYVVTNDEMPLQIWGWGGGGSKAGLGKYGGAPFVLVNGAKHGILTLSDTKIFVKDLRYNLSLTNNDGRNVLHEASVGGYLPIVRFLIEEFNMNVHGLDSTNGKSASVIYFPLTTS